MAESLTLGGEQIRARAACAAQEDLTPTAAGMGRTEIINKQMLTRPFMWSIVVIGSAVFLFFLHRLNWTQLDLKFLLLALMVIVCSRVAVPIPRVSGRITVSDTLIFLTMLLYGGEAAILLAAMEGICSSL